MNRTKKFAALALVGGALLQFGGCWNAVLFSLLDGFATSLISQIFPIGITEGGNLF